MIIRETYLQKLRGLVDQKLIKVVTGIRRSGKSTLLVDEVQLVDDFEKLINSLFRKKILTCT